MATSARRGLAILWGIASLASPALALEGAPAESVRQEGYSVQLDGEEVFRLYDLPGSRFRPEERVAITERRVLEIAQDPFYATALVTTERVPDGVWILYRERRVGFVADADAAILGTTAERRSGEVIEAVDRAVTRFRERRRPEEWLRSALLLAGATLALVLALRLLGALFRRAVGWVEVRGRAGLTGPHRLGFRNAARFQAFQLRVLRLLRGALVALLGLAYLQAAFAIVPLTRGYALSVLDYALEPLRIVWNSLLENVGDVFFIVVMVALARLTLRALLGLLREADLGTLSLPGIPRGRGMPVYKIARIAVVAITAVMIYPYIPGSNSAAFQGISLFAGALFTLGASSTASNFIGGMVLVFSGAFQVGDRVMIRGIVGDVEESTLSLTRIRTPKNELVTFANATVLSESFVNYSTMARRDGVVVYSELTIGYDVPWRKVHALLIQAATLTEGVVAQPAPFVLQTSLNDFHVGYQINAYTRQANAMAQIRSELNQNIQDAFAEAGVEILSPAYSALRDGNASTLPATDGDSA